MRRIAFFLVVALAGCSDDQPSHTGMKPNSLHIEEMAEGGKRVTAVAEADGKLVRVSVEGVGVIESIGAGAEQIRFPDCGKVVFVRDLARQDVVKSTHKGIGGTAKCPIRNWDREWSVKR
ncbi:hypothetical protein D9M70_535300 [compost metagenome]